MSVSSAEHIVMKALWAKAPLTAEEIVATVAADQNWSDATVKTLLNRLLNKGAIAADKDGRRYLYRPLLEEDFYVSEQSKGLLDRFFDGRISAMVSHFSERETLSADEIAELKRLIAELDDGER